MNNKHVDVHFKLHITETHVRTSSDSNEQTLNQRINVINTCAKHV